MVGEFKDTAATGHDRDFAPPVLAGYRILKRVGIGGTAEIHLAESPEGRLVVMKLMLPASHTPDDVAEQFIRETRALRRLDHPNILKILDDGIAHEMPFAVLEHVPGLDLDALIRYFGPLPLETALSIGRKIALGLGAIHRAGLLQRDIKPSNILLGIDGRVKIADFGLAKDLTLEDSFSRDGLIFGTPNYMSPEQCRGERLTAATDIYSLGATLYAALVGRPPFDAGRTSGVLRRLIEDSNVFEEDASPLSESARALIDRLMAKRPADRPASASDVLAEIERTAPAVDDEAIAALVRDVRGQIDQARQFFRKPGGASPVGCVAGYELIEELGRGGMGIVYRARQTALNRIVALKIMLPGAFGDERAVTRFEREARTAARLQHPNLVPIHEVGADGETRFYSMALIHGESLAQMIRARRRLEPVFAARLLAAVARALHHAHQSGIVHRDIKPGNILLDTFSTPFLSDFGLAKEIDTDRAQTVNIVGTPAYLSPEAVSGIVMPRSDIYAMGAVLYECLTGATPFSGDSLGDVLKRVVEREPVRPRSLRADLPRDIEAICLKCLEKDPPRRYATAAELADDLERFALDEPVRARMPGLARKLYVTVRRRKAVAAMAGALVLGLLTAGGFLWRLQLERERDGRRAEWAMKVGEAVSKLLQWAPDSIRYVDDRSFLAPADSEDRERKQLHAFERRLTTVKEKFPDVGALDAWHGWYTAWCVDEASGVREMESAVSSSDRPDPFSHLLLARYYLRRYLLAIDPVPTYGDGAVEPGTFRETPQMAGWIRRARDHLAAAEAVPMWKNVAEGKEIMTIANVSMAVAAGSLDGVAGLLERLLDHPVYGDEARYLLGMARFLQGNYAGAAESWDPLVEDRPAWVAVRYWRGRTRLARYYLNLPDSQKAEPWIDAALEDFNEVLRRNPTYAIGYNDRGLIHMRRGEDDEALRDFELCLKYRPDYAASWNNRSLIWDRRDETDRAIEEISRAITIDPNSALFRIHRAGFHLRTGLFAEAMEDCAEAIRIDPGYGYAFEVRGLIHMAQEDPDAALDALTKALELDERLHQARFQRAHLRLRKGDTDGALEDYDRIIDLDPDQPNVLNQRGVLLFQLKKPDEAAADFRLALDVAPPDWPIREIVERNLTAAEDPLARPRPKDAGWLGVRLEDVEGKGAAIVKVEPDSPAARAALQAGDVIVRIDASEIGDVRDSIVELRRLEIGRAVTLTVRRGDEELSVVATLGRAPQE